MIHQVVRWQRAKARQGSHSTLNRATMTGGGKKPFKQKGTGNARAGTRNSPLWRGGAVIFGPTPRNYEFKVQKKIKKQAILATIKSKFEEDVAIIVDGLSIDAPKTKKAVDALANLSIGKKDKALFLYSSNEENVGNFVTAAKNISRCELLTVSGLNVYAILNAKQLVITKTALDEIIKKYSTE
ncbi:UNVERIFIED_CONTAM: hypothetical protein GTU68_051323 [Idotea baltica]|nr:hypothetical protein [Idotea baltica]